MNDEEKAGQERLAKLWAAAMAAESTDSETMQPTGAARDAGVKPAPPTAKPKAEAPDYSRRAGDTAAGRRIADPYAADADLAGIENAAFDSPNTAPANSDQTDASQKQSSQTTPTVTQPSSDAEASGMLITDAAVDTHATATPESASAAAGQSASAAESDSLAALLDIPIRLSLEVGSREISLGELMDLRPGMLLQLDAAVNTPLNVLANGTLIAQGEVVQINDHYGLQLTSIIDRRERIQGLK